MWSQALRARLPKPSVVVGRVNFSKCCPTPRLLFTTAARAPPTPLSPMPCPNLWFPTPQIRPARPRGWRGSGVGYRIAPKM